MIILAIDTSTNVASCAVMDDERLLGESMVNDSVTHSQKLLPLISETLDRCKIDIEEIDLFAVANGPGSFTGLRIGVSTINGLAQAMDKPVIGISSLEALAHNVSTSEKLIVPLLDARRDRSFTGIYRSDLGENHMETILEPDVLEMSDILEILDKKQEDLIFIGNGMDIYREQIIDILGERAYFTPGNLNIARASSVALIARQRAKKGQTQSYFELVPDYLRETQAQREYDEKAGKSK